MCSHILYTGQGVVSMVIHMEKFDALFVGGGIAGSVGARFAAEYGLKTLLIEKEQVPRHKCCSAIQFPYFEKLVGSKIPRNKLCRNELNKVELVTPDDDVLNTNMDMLNFWRSTFDHWLNQVAAEHGADFRDSTKLIDFKKQNGGWSCTLKSPEGTSKVFSEYLLAADGGNSQIRRKVKPNDFSPNNQGAAINLYFKGDPGRLDPNTLYMIHKKEYSTLMFSWIYKKDDDWIIGTGADHDPMGHLDRFYRYVQDTYGIKGEVVSKKGFSSTQSDKMWLGTNDLLFIGDSAGLVDLYRGVGMDVAALSARFAAKAIHMSENEGGASPGERYRALMSGVIKQKERHDRIQKQRYASDEALKKSLSKGTLMKGGLKLITYQKINKLLPPEKMVLLPP